jgi:hypothetical protein
VLLMIAVAVAASLVTYAWVMGYLGFTTNKVGKAIQVQSVDQDGNAVYVQNVGDSEVKIIGFYVNGVLDDAALAQIGSGTPVILDGTNTLTLPKTETATITADITFTVPQVTVKVVTVDGISAEFTKTFP